MRGGKRQLVRTIVFEAFERFEDDAEARESFVRERCGQAADMLTVAMAEIAAEERLRNGRFMEKPAVAALSQAIPEGTEIGDYRIGTLVGEGAMGAVYKARQISLDRDVAVKFLRTHMASQAKARFLVEARTLSRIDSARVVHVYSYGDYQGQPYIAMEYSEGTNLAQMIADQRFPDVPSRLRIAQQVAEGLEHIHLANIAHRDVKPSNVFVDVAGKIKLIDFGIAWREDARLTEAGQVLGTPAYMPPELIQRQWVASVSDVERYQRADIYSFGILLYELLTGTLPFAGETRGAVEREIVNTPVSLQPLKAASVPESVATLIRQATAKNPSARPHSFGEVVSVLQDALLEPPARAARRQPLRWLATSSILAGIAFAGFLSLRHAPAPAGKLPELLSTNAVESRPPGISDEVQPSTASPSQRPAPMRPPPVVPQPQPSAAPPANQAQDPAPATTAAPERPTAVEPAVVEPVVVPAPAPKPEESPEEREWNRVRETADAASLQAFEAAYPNGAHAREARELAARIEYDAVKAGNNLAALHSFARKYPEQPQARIASAVARQLDARAAAAEEIRRTLERYATAIRAMKVDQVALQRELSKEQRTHFVDMFRGARRIEVTITLLGPPEFDEPVVPDPAAADHTPSTATVRIEYDQLTISGGGDSIPTKQHYTPHLKRTGTTWKITSL